MFKKLTCTD
jgi:hypothetical protein